MQWEQGELWFWRGQLHRAVELRVVLEGKWPSYGLGMAGEEMGEEASLEQHWEVGEGDVVG